MCADSDASGKLRAILRNWFPVMMTDLTTFNLANNSRLPTPLRMPFAPSRENHTGNQRSLKNRDIAIFHKIKLDFHFVYLNNIKVCFRFIEIVVKD
jgi:hypothetical protein